MKKLLFLLLFIPLMSIGQNIIIPKIVKSKVISYGETVVREKVVLDTLNIAEIQDEFIQIQLGKRFHLLSTSKHKNVKIWKTYNQKKWNVFDGDKLISLTDEIDVLNYFNKYGFELLKTGGNSVTGAKTSLTPYFNQLNTSFTMSKSVLTFKKKD